MADPAVPIKRWTRREYDRMAEAGIFNQDDRVQLIEGDIVETTHPLPGKRVYRSFQKLSPSDSIAPLAAATATVAVGDLLP